jgi:hypothetical protein
MIKPKVFKQVHYSTDDNGQELVIDAWANEAQIVIGSTPFEIGSCEKRDLEEWRDMFQAAINDIVRADNEA